MLPKNVIHLMSRNSHILLQPQLYALWKPLTTSTPHSMIITISWFVHEQNRATFKYKLWSRCNQIIWWSKVNNYPPDVILDHRFSFLRCHLKVWSVKLTFQMVKSTWDIYVQFLNFGRNMNRLSTSFVPLAWSFPPLISY